MNKKVVQAPGKIILFGEHSVVYPSNLAIATSVDIKWRAGAIKSKNTEIIKLVHNKSPQFSFEEKVDNVRKFYELVKKKYVEYINGESFDDFKNVFRTNYNDLQLCIGIADEYLKQNGVDLFGMEINLECNVPYTSGFGASSSVGSIIISCILGLAGLKPSNDEIFELTYKFEKFEHGNPSGLDPAAVVYGGLVKYRKVNSEKKEIKQIEIKNKKLVDIMSKCMIIHTGGAEETTGMMVDLVSKKREKNPDEVEKIFAGINKIIEEFLNLASENFNVNAEEKFIDAINANGILLESLGVVSIIGEEICTKIRKLGGAAKMSGAGGIKDSCGAILVYHKDIKVINKIASEFGYKLFNTGFGVSGLKSI